MYASGSSTREFRDRAFYLIKKYTSATLLTRAIDLYGEFLYDFERATTAEKNLSSSIPGQAVDYSDDLIAWLKYLEPMEYARPLLTQPNKRREAFDALKRGVHFLNFIWGRRYQESMAGEPGNLLYNMGYRWSPSESVDIFAKAALAADLFSLGLTTTNKAARLYLLNPRETLDARTVMRWTYDSMFFDSVPFNGVPPIIFPTHLPSCPPKNENNEGQVWTGQAIPVTGIWEPWPVDPGAGARCPNYYFSGDMASQYQMEGTDTFEDVRWRLIWKDDRYVNGEIPAEEADYFGSQPTRIAAPVKRVSYPGETCPQSGKWYSNHLNKTMHLQAGDVMPGPQYSPSGNLVAWYLRDA
jgi:hypothetical protein